VEVVAAGPGELLDRLAERLSKGPATARVEAVELKGVGHQPPGDGFHILR
jgi:acylphosphatase